MIATGGKDVLAAAPPRAQALRRALVGVWGARGWWGSLIAIGLAALGQNALLTQADPAAAGRDYLLAILLLIAVWLHPTRLWPGQWATSAPAPPPVVVETQTPIPAAQPTPAIR